MSFLDVIEQCGTRGIKLSVKEDRLVINDARKRLDDALLAQLKAAKPEIIAWLQGAGSAPALRRRGLSKAPLSFTQQRLWLVDQVEGGSAQYNVPTALRLDGELDVAALRRALEIVVERHEVLRTVYAVEAGEPVQIVLPARALDVAEHDLTALDGDAQDAAVRELAAAEALRPFDLARDLMLRCSLVNLGAQRRVILLTLHHIAADGWSSGVLLRDFAAAFDAVTHGRNLALAPLPLQYADYAHWQREHLRGETLERLVAYWRTRLAGMPPLHALLLDRARPAQQGFRAGYHRQRIDAALLGALRALAREHDATLFMLLHAAFALLVGRASDSDDVVVGVPIAGREQQGLDELIGFFNNTLVFRTQLAPAQRFVDFLAQSRRDALDAYAHQEIPFEALVDELKPERSLGYNPLCQIKFTLGSDTSDAKPATAGAMTPVDSGVASIHFDLDLTGSERPDALVLDWSYKQELFDAATIAQLADAFGVLLQGIVDAPATPVAQLPLVASVQHEALVAQGIGVASTRGREHVLPVAIAQASQLHGDAVAVRDARGGELTHAQLDAQSNRLAQYLVEQGIAAGQRVGIVTERSIELPVALLGVLKSGAAYVPLDPRQGKARLAEIAADAQLAWVLASSSRSGELTLAGVDLVTLDGVADANDWLAGYPDDAPAIAIDPASAAYVIYTSGSTGKPKGVEIRHSGLMDYCAFAQGNYYTDDLNGSLVVTSAAFDLTVPSLYVPLLAGGTVELLPDDGELEAMADRLASGNDNALMRMTPGHVQAVLALLPDAPLANRHVFVIGGEAFTPSLAAALQQRFPNATIWNHYGPTETVVGCALHRFDAEVDRDRVSLPIGHAMENTRLYVLDAQGQLVPNGVAGELHIGGAGVAIGYLHREALTAQKFVADPFVAGERVYRSGDRVRWHDGELEFLGRVDDQVKLRGYRIELGEIEARLRERDDVADVAVVVRGADDAQRLVAYVVPTQAGVSGWIETLRAALAASLPDYMVPSAFVSLPTLPRTPNGKIDRRNLPEPDVAEAEAGQAPTTTTEVVVAEIWNELLKRKLPGVTANFFALGGNSLLATRVVSAIGERLHRKVAVRAVFEHPNVRALAAFVDAQAATAHRAIPRAPRDGQLALSFAQQRLWFIDQLEGATPHYNIPIALRLKGPLEVAALQHALDALVERHEVLRTRYRSVDGEARQLIDAPAPVALQRHTLDANAPDHRDALRRLAAEVALRPFALGDDAMLRANLIAVGAEEHVLLLTMHHIAGDGWSNAILVREALTLYQAFASGQAAQLEPMPIQYADYAQWQRAGLQGASLERLLAYWRDDLAGIPAVHALPLDRARPQRQRFHARQHGQRLDGELLQGLRNLAKTYDATLFMVLQSAFATLLARLSGEDDIVIGVPVAGRDHRDLENVIGLFVNTLVFRTRTAPALRYDELLAQSRQQALNAFAHQALPFETLVDELKPERNLGYNPLCQIKFTLQNYAGEALASSGMAITPVDTGVSTIRFDLDLTASEGANVLQLDWTFKEELFDERTIAQFADAFGVLLQGIVDAPATPLAQLPLVAPVQHETLVAQGIGATSTRGREHVLPVAIAQAARQHGDAIAVRDAQGRTLTRTQLEVQANRLAQYLVEQGIGAGQRVGIVTERSVELPVALLAVLKSGAAYVPLDPRQGKARLAEIAADAQLAWVLASSSRSGELTLAGVDLVTLDGVADANDWLAGYPDDAPALAIDPASAAYVIYTSGSTGKPKGVEIRHSGLMDYCAFAHGNYYADDLNGSLVVTSAAFDLTVPSLYVPLLAGGTVELLPDDGELEALADRLASGTDNALMRMTPGHVQAVLALLPDAPLANRHVFVIGGEAFTPSLATQLQQRFPHATIYNHYGPTETVVGCALHRFNAEADRDRVSLSIGGAMENTRLYVLDAQGQLVPNGVAGELHIGGAGVAIGYLHREELTAQKFVADPFASGERVYRSGDRVRWNNGELEFLGRVDDQVKLRGYRIELGEIEARLRQRDDVADVAVVVRGTDDAQRLVAYVVPKETQHEAWGETLRAALAANLPDYMVPSAFVALSTLPRTPNGKVDRKSLPDVQAPAGAGYVAPRNAVEAALCEIWAKLLRLERVGIHDNFFAIGGDSIQSILAVARANQAGIRLTTRQMFEAQTVAALAAIAGEGATELPQQPVEGELVLLPVQQRFFASSDVDRHHYNQAILLHAPAGFAAAALVPIVEALYARHDALRLTFSEHDGAWRAAHVPLADIDRAALCIVETQDDDADAATWIQRRCQHWQQRFDLAHGPLLRVVHLRSRDGERLLVLAHHLVVDGVSWRVLLADIEAAYAQWQGGDAIVLPPKTSSLQRWGEMVAAQATSAELAQERTYWMAQLADDTDALASLPKPASDATGVESASIELGADETDALLRRCGTAYRTQVNELLLAAVYLALRRRSGARTLRIALEGHGRDTFDDSVDLSQTVGWFTTIHPLGIAADGDTTADAIVAAKESLRAIPRNGIGYGILRHLAGDTEFAARAAACEPALLFNYLGQFDDAGTADARFTLATESVGATISARRPRAYPLTLTGVVNGGVLRFNLTSDRSRVASDALKDIAERIGTALRDVVAHCLVPGVGRRTPSDFPLAHLDAPRLAALHDEFPGMTQLYPATPMQQGMLFHSWIDRASYLTQTIPVLVGTLDTRKFREAWQRVIERHAVFRTAFVPDGERLLQVVLDAVELPWHEEDWSALTADEQTARFEAYRKADTVRGFEFKPAPLMRVAVFHLGRGRTQLLWTLHHALTDGWSSPLVYKEVMVAYQAAVANVLAPLADAPVYQRYIEWLCRRDVESARAHWRGVLAGIRAPTALPLDDGGPRDSGHAEVAQYLAPEATAALVALARRHRTTVNTLVQLAWAILLERHSGEADVVFGATISGRPPDVAGIESMVGLFINTIPVRVGLGARHDVGELVAELHENFQRSNEQGFLALPDIQRQSQLPATSFLFDSILVFENYPLDAATEAAGLDLDLRIESAHKEVHTNYRLTVVAALFEKLELRINYDLAAYGRGAAERVLAQLCHILGQFASGVDDVRAIDLVDASARAQLDAWNATAMDYPADACVHELVEHWADTAPDRVAVEFGDASLTYAELDARANRVAQCLTAHGTKPGDVVAVCLPRSLDMLVGLVGVLKAGAAYVPLDPAYPVERLDYMLNDSRAAVVVTDNVAADALPVTYASLVMLDDEAMLAKYPATRATPRERGLTAQDLAYVIYTSGSTGEPKGVLLRHGGAVNLAQNQRRLFDVDAGSRVLQFASLSFDAATWDWLMALANGATLCICSDEQRASPPELGRHLRDAGITHATLPPALLPYMDADLGYPALRALIVAGEACEEGSAWQWASRVPLYNAYGPTEATVCASVARVRAGAPITIGSALANVELHVLDAALRVLPVGAVGELYIGGAGLAQGYLGRAELTDAAFVADPRDASRRLYRSGDLVYRRADGELVFVGRRDNQVKIRGFRIELGEIEAALLRLPSAPVREAAVVALDDRGDKRLAAYVVPREDDADHDRLVDTLRSGLADMLPRHCLPSGYVVLDKLPLTQSGKIDRQALPDAPEMESTAAIVPPATATERCLVAIWSRLLSVPAERIGTQASFFELGGHSLSMIQMQAAIRAELGVEISATTLFEKSTLARLAELIDGFLLLAPAAAGADGDANNDLVEETL
jgi:amino acid adenylation domain-containing protein/non-ribosomal peptide synthase protein (TIGR01720 family)